VLPLKSVILRSFLSAESFFFRNEQFFIVMSWCGGVNFSYTAYDAEGCRDFRGGDGGEVPSAGMTLYQTDLAFFRSDHRIAYARNLRMSGS
jgi:hypothetical protein